MTFQAAKKKLLAGIAIVLVTVLAGAALFLWNGTASQFPPSEKLVLGAATIPLFTPIWVQTPKGSFSMKPWR